MFNVQYHNGRRHISTKNLKTSSLRVTSLIYPTFYSFICDAEINHSHMKSKNLLHKRSTPLKSNQGSDTTCWEVRGHARATTGPMLYDYKGREMPHLHSKS
ncbi:hypothetical protein MTR_5g049070 [Medicago truncatula]|uniref:Uncharacterized protein n=1 Tax=Medicago truncatula TaxID=3880 RepID=A0A072UFN1_MEDTR|nr:hypothetical protein MTR_5g049070 [Medicago truncatula]